MCAGGSCGAAGSRLPAWVIRSPGGSAEPGGREGERDGVMARRGQPEDPLEPLPGFGWGRGCGDSCAVGRLAAGSGPDDSVPGDSGPVEAAPDRADPVAGTADDSALWVVGADDTTGGSGWPTDGSG